MQVDGLKTYEMMFTADVGIKQDALYAVDAQTSSELGEPGGNTIRAQEYRDLSREGLNAFFYASQGLMEARTGDVLHLTGAVTFEKRESGWVPTQVHFTVNHDSAARSHVTQAGISANAEGTHSSSVTDPNVGAMKAALRRLVTAEESYFASHRTYSTRLVDLGFEPPSGMSGPKIVATSVDWTATITDSSVPGVICGVAMGHANPVVPNAGEGDAACDSSQQH
jgi:hypothetical protein